MGKCKLKDFDRYERLSTDRLGYFVFKNRIYSAGFEHRLSKITIAFTNYTNDVILLISYYGYTINKLLSPLKNPANFTDDELNEVIKCNPI